MLLSAEDRAEIAGLAARACHATDHFRAEEWADLFTPDAIVSVSDGLRLLGREQLVRHVRAKQAEGIMKRHVVGSVVIDGDGDEASMEAYVTVFRVDQSPAVVAIFGEYSYRLVRQDGSWKIRLRHTTLLPGHPPPP